MNGRRNPRRQPMLKSLVLCAAWMSMASAQALDIDLGNAAPFSAFVFEDVSGLTTAAGRVAVGGNLALGAATLGAGTPTLTATPTLLVRGNITSYSGGALWSGANAGYGLYLGSKAASTAATLDLRKASGLPVDFEAERIYLGVMSEQLRDLASSGSVNVTGTALTLSGNNSDLEVFSLTAAQVAGSQVLAVTNVRPDAHIVVNLSADALRRITFGIDTAALANWKGRVLFNAHDAETLQFNGLTFWGSLLATNACLCNSTGRLEGSVVARKWTAAMTISYTPFIPKP
jgi:choice-of-anchor A domain-containing protein